MSAGRTASKAQVAFKTRHEAGFIGGDGRALVIEEVQRATDLLREIKASVDRDREGFLDALLAGEPEALADAARPLGRDEIRERMVAGGFPEAVGRTGTRRRRWFDSYLDTVLQREVRDIANGAGLAELPRLMLLLAARSTGLLNYSGIARAARPPAGR